MSFRGILQWIFGRRPAPSPPVPVDPGDDPATTMIQLHNATRAVVGLGPLAADTKLALAAGIHAANCARWGRLDHAGWDAEIRASGFTGAPIGQNLEAGSSDARSAFMVLNNDPPHRANILGNFTRIGVGIADAGGVRWWAINYGSES